MTAARPKSTPIKIGSPSQPPPPKGAQLTAIAIFAFGLVAVLGFVFFKSMQGRAREPSVVVLPSTLPDPGPSNVGSAPPALQMVSITTEPAGALVTVEGAVVGHTPLQLPRPTHRVEATLDLDGYAQQHVALSELVAAEVSFTLTPERASSNASSMRPLTTRTPQTTTTSTASPPDPPAMQTRMTELVDPWR
jgi:hypothetical protein